MQLITISNERGDEEAVDNPSTFKLRSVLVVEADEWTTLYRCVSPLTVTIIVCRFFFSISWAKFFPGPRRPARRLGFLIRGRARRRYTEEFDRKRKPYAADRRFNA